MVAASETVNGIKRPSMLGHFDDLVSCLRGSLARLLLDLTLIIALASCELQLACLRGYCSLCPQRGRCLSSFMVGIRHVVSLFRFFRHSEQIGRVRGMVEVGDLFFGRSQAIKCSSEGGEEAHRMVSESISKRSVPWTSSFNPMHGTPTPSRHRNFWLMMVHGSLQSPRGTAIHLHFCYRIVLHGITPRIALLLRHDRSSECARPRYEVGVPSCHPNLLVLPLNRTTRSRPP